ncbi:MAG: type II toxin-antitoxin system HicB family antitoxin [bacterium]|nr:type II toxin-antitoxin system HicB family antitoxin [bacterium]
MHKYRILLSWSNQDGAFVAEVPDLPGCMAHGDTQQSALDHVQQAMDLWIDTARDLGRPVPEPRNRPLTPA